MNAEEALEFVEELLNKQEQRLNDLQRLVFLGAWQGKDYKEIHKICGDRCSLDHLKRNIGYGLWKLLTPVLGEKVGKGTLQGTVEKTYRRWLEQQAETLALSPDSLSEANGRSLANEPQPNLELSSSHMFPDWGEAPADTSFFGRSGDLADLEQRIRIDGCRLLTVHGIAGIGKTLLATKLAEQVRDQFEFLIWRSLSLSPSPTHLIGTLIQFFSHQQDSATDLTSLFHYLQNQRCLILLDGLETVLQPGVHDGSYRPGYEEYGELLRQMGRIAHQSCLIVTSQEKPKDMVDSRQVYALELRELGDWEGQEIFTARGVVSRSASNWRELVRRYTGNPFALNVVASTVQEMFAGNLDTFLNQLPQDIAIFEDIRTRLAQQFDRLSELEKRVIHCLQATSDPLSHEVILHTLESLGQPLSWMQLNDVLRSLQRRSLIKPNAAGFSLQSLMSEYVRSYQK